ncbi:MAG: hypothetical protein HYS09_05225 [Chloroflexi bacterium]|nr:hypothetical protein [Chloroflexota bacterium]
MDDKSEEPRPPVRRRPRRRGSPGKPRAPAKADASARRALATLALLVLPLAAGGLAVGIALAVIGGGGESGEKADVRELGQQLVDLPVNRDWPALYALFNDDYKARCRFGEFRKVWEDAVAALSPNQANYRVKSVEDIKIEGDEASATLVTTTGEVEDRFRYEMVRQGGAWRFAPAAGTTKCDAFLRETQAQPTGPQPTGVQPTP